MDVIGESLCLLCRPYTRLVHIAEVHKETTLMEKRTSPSHTHTNITPYSVHSKRPHVLTSHRSGDLNEGLANQRNLSLTNKGMLCWCDLNALLTVYHIWRLAHGWIQTNKRGGGPGTEVNSLCTCVCMHLIRVELVWLMDRNDAGARHFWWWHQRFDGRLESKHIFLLCPSRPAH